MVARFPRGHGFENESFVPDAAYLASPLSTGHGSRGLAGAWRWLYDKVVLPYKDLNNLKEFSDGRKKQIYRALEGGTP